MTATIVSGNLFDSQTKNIAHQTNCVTNRSAHLAASMFARYPYADVYTGRKIPNVPGTIVVCGNGNDQRFVINMMAQFYPGKPRFPNSSKDGYDVRCKYFYSCLKEIATIPYLESIAFPWGIGCGAAGGNWEYYHGLIDRFAKYIDNLHGYKTFVYKFDADQING